MLRSRLKLGILALAGLFCWAGIASAEEPRPSAADGKPAGLRVVIAGNSWHTENSAPLCQAAGITGHARIPLKLMDAGDSDAFVLGQTDWGVPPNVRSLAEAAVKRNPRFRVLVQEPWLVGDGRNGVRSVDDYENTDLAEYQVTLEKYRTAFEAEVDALNSRFGGRVFFIVPVGDGMIELRKMIAAGKFPGMTKQAGGSVLGGDLMPHAGLLGIRLGTFMHFAALYRMSPEGLVFPGKDGDGLSDAQRVILQKLAWRMVSNYPYAGIAKHDAAGATNQSVEPAGKGRAP